jgi:N-carbamoylputrescine amidase
MKIKIAAIQIGPSLKRDQTLEKALNFAKSAVERGAQILCFPELFPYPWFPAKVDKDAFQLAETLEDQLIGEMSSFAREKGIILLVSFFEKGEGEYYNSVAVISPQGSVIGVYRKVHLPDIPLWEERSYFASGNDFPVFEIEGLKFGVQLSWDNLFPEGPRILALKGAEILFAPTACAFRTQQRWLKLLAGHAICNGFFVVRVNRVGKEEFQHFYGMSFFLDPEGELIGEPAGLEEGILLAELDLEEAKRAKKEWYLLRDRKPNLYGELVR